MRPGGLTALAVFNFILSASGALGSLGMVAMALLGPVVEGAGPERPTPFDAVVEFGAIRVVLLAAGSFVVAALGVLSGIGYLKLRKFLGRTVGNVYAVFSIVSTIPWLWAPVAVGGGFDLSVLLSVLYPILTLVLINTTFREDLVN